MKTTTWGQISGETVSRAAKLLDGAHLRFVMVVFAGREGAVLSNLEPAEAIDVLEKALTQTKGHFEAQEATLQ